jgi:uncharacterized membrane protein
LQELVGYSALIGGVVIPGIALLGLALIPYLDREQKRIGYWFTDAAGKRWGTLGLVWGLLWTVAALAIGILFPMRSVFPNIESQLFFDLVNPSTLLLISFVILYFLVLKVSSSTRTAAIATFCAFIIAFVLLTWTGTMLRGPNWDFFWPWEPWPVHAIPF